MNMKFGLGGIGLIGITALFFNNCAGQGFVTQTESEFGAFASAAGGGSCEDQLLAKYKTILHPFFSNSSRCLNCHSGNGPGIGAFANPDPKISMDSALNLGVNRLLQQSVSSHQPGFTGSQNTNIANSAGSQWQTAYSQYTTCSSASNSVQPEKSGTLSLSSNPIGSLSETESVSFIFDLSQATSQPLPLRVTLEVRLLVLNGVVQGYQFLNPRASLISSGGSYDVTALRIYINGVYQSNITTYSNLHATVNSVNNIPLISQSESAISVRTPQATDRIAVELVLNSASTTNPNPGTPASTPSPTPSPSPTPTVVTFQQLTMTGGVFQQRCYSCHSGGRISASLDLSNYQQAQAAARNIKSRINNSSNPMPVGGLMSLSEREKVNAWVDAGAPR